MATKVNGGIINSETLTGSLKFFKMTGPFAWTVSDGTVNMPVSSTGGTNITTYFVVGENRPVPDSAAELALKEISERCGIVMIGLVGDYGSTTAVHFACSASAFGFVTDTPAVEMQAAVRALGNVTVHVSTGAFDQSATPVTATANLATVTITEVPFRLA